MSDVSRVSDQQPQLIQGITGIILSGGKSSRYGMNKALASFKGTTIIERVVRVMNSLFHKTILITNDPKEYTYLNLPVYPDIIKGIGPVGGIFTGLESMTDPIGFVVACDMPFLNPDLIRYMISRKSGYDAVVPKVGWKIESLHALYHRDCLPAIRENIKTGVYQAIQFHIKVRTLYIQETEIRRYDPELRSFYNINRPQELQEARELVDHSL
jgi:molybdopterin-guanine dinucleotide biosynthesis protein A